MSVRTGQPHYDDSWADIAGVFAKEAILQGSLDKYAESTKAKKGTAEVDKGFLGEIEGWRDALARNIALRNPSLSQRELNYAVQATIKDDDGGRPGDDAGPVCPLSMIGSRMPSVRERGA